MRLLAAGYTSLRQSAQRKAGHSKTEKNDAWEFKCHHMQMLLVVMDHSDGIGDMDHCLSIGLLASENVGNLIWKKTTTVI